MEQQLRLGLKKPFRLSMRQSPVTEEEWSVVLAALPDYVRKFLQEGKDRGYFEANQPQHYRLIEGINQHLAHQTSLLFRIRSVRSRHQLVGVIKVPHRN